MGSTWKLSHLGFAMMVCSPVMALGLGWEAFFPVALTSIIGGTIVLAGKSVSTHMFVGKLTAELVQDLVFADKDRRDWGNLSLQKRSGFWPNSREQRPNCGANKSGILVTAARKSAGLGEFDTP